MAIKEIYKNIPGYQGRYKVSNLGRVVSVDSVISYADGRKTLHKGKELNQHDNGRGYLFVALWKNNKSKQEYVHRLVASAFIPNGKPSTKIQVNHIDENKQNNNATNLEWVTQLENIRHGTGLARMGLGHSKAVRAAGAYSIRQYRSGAEAARELGLCPNSIRRAAKRERHFAGFWWSYV